MANIEKRGKAWRALVRRKGHKAVSKTFDSYQEAEAWAVATEAGILDGQRPQEAAAEASGTTVADLMARYAADISPGKRGARWEIVRLSRLQKAPQFRKLVSDFDPADVAEWRDARLKEISAGSVNRELNLVSAVFNCAIKEWRVQLKANPVHLVMRPKNPRARTQRVPEEALKAICGQLGWAGDAEPSGASQWTAFAFSLAVATAMRKGEVLSVLWKHLHLDAGYLHLPVTKNGDARDVPLSSVAVALLRGLKEGAPNERVVKVASGTLDGMFREAKLKAKLPEIHFHDSRREATTGFSKKVNVLELAKITGHRSLKSLMGYYEPDPGDLAKKLG